MTIFKRILNLFSVNSKKTKRSQISDEVKERFERKFNDVGKFRYEEDGFIFQSSSGEQKVKWADIERLVAYKKDLVTIDEICLDIIYNNREITVTEETVGWYQFLQKIRLEFPSIPENWDSDIAHPAFATNLRVLYQRADREMPDENNFYARLSNIPKTTIIDVFEKNGWSVRKSGWSDFELSNSWTELILEETEGELLLNGRVAFHKNNLILIDCIFDSLGGSYIYEFYNKDKELLIERKKEAN